MLPSLAGCGLRLAGLALPIGWPVWLRRQWRQPYWIEIRLSLTSNITNMVHRAGASLERAEPSRDCF
jgi:hypothetical protein